MSTPIYDFLSHHIKHQIQRPAERVLDAQLDTLFLSAERIVGTNVTQYFYAGTDQEFWHLDQHFPNLAPPFDSFWIETKAPTHIRSKLFGEQPWTVADTEYYQRPQRWGAWFLHVKPPAEGYSQEIEHIFHAAGMGSVSNYWLYTIMLFMPERVDGPPYPVWTVTILVHKETGLIVRNPKATTPDPFLWASDPVGHFREQVEEIEKTRPDIELPVKLDSGRRIFLTPRQAFEHEALALMKPLMLTISFMHCRNVERVPQYPSPKLNKKRLARNLPPMHKFYTLEIEPMKKIIQQAIASHRGLHGASGIEMALHTVKGHFKTYTPERPLMGHAVGTWFWAGITRGSKKRGTVKKDYEVKL